jgi:hypothetical protein
MVRKIAPFIGCVSVYSFGSIFRLLRGCSAKGVAMRTYPSVKGPQNQYRMNCAMLACRRHWRCSQFTGFRHVPLAVRRLKITPLPVLLKEPGDFRTWHFATFRCAAEFDRYRGIADIEQTAPIKAPFMKTSLWGHHGYSRTCQKVARRTGDYAGGGFGRTP